MGAEPRSDPPRRRLGKYELLSVLGRGAMGVVYRAVDPALGRPVAIKTMSLAGEGPDEHELRERFLREARAAGRLQHPNIVTVHELFEEDGAAYMVMELLEGASLSALLRKGRAFSLAEKLSILLQIAAGLEAAHRNGIVHRDLKPSNVHLARGGVVKILDFGVAKVGEGELTKAGTVFGTVEYMAPEQVRGESVDAVADVFSWGVVAYELLSGRNPFRAETLGASVFKILSDRPEPLGTVVDAVPPPRPSPGPPAPPTRTSRSRAGPTRSPPSRPSTRGRTSPPRRDGSTRRTEPASRPSSARTTKAASSQ